MFLQHKSQFAVSTCLKVFDVSIEHAYNMTAISSSFMVYSELLKLCSVQFSEMFNNNNNLLSQQALMENCNM